MAAGKAVTVYCASSVGNHPVYVRAAQCRFNHIASYIAPTYRVRATTNRPTAVGKAIAESKRTLIYGGGSGGIMGAVSGAVLDAGGEVTGVVPYAMVAAGGEVDLTQGKRGPAVLLKEKGRERVRSSKTRSSFRSSFLSYFVHVGRNGRSSVRGSGHIHGALILFILCKVVVNTMHERKTEMAKRSDSFIALPGGFGTFEEASPY